MLYRNQVVDEYRDFVEENKKEPTVVRMSEEYLTNLQNELRADGMPEADVLDSSKQILGLAVEVLPNQGDVEVL